MELELDFERWRQYISSALAHDSSHGHTADDVLDAIRKGDMQLWPGASSVIVTQVQQFPQIKSLCFFVAAGNLAELKSMLPSILDWGRGQGCQTAFLVGRAGWARSFLRDGWKQSAIVMETVL